MSKGFRISAVVLPFTTTVRCFVAIY